MGGLSFLLGLIIGSFTNAVVYRLPRGVSFTSGRSKCPHCSHVLSAWELIPLLSWLILGAKCRHCHERISVRYPLIELYVGILFVLVYRTYAGGGLNIEGAIFSAFLIVLFLMLAVIDLERLLLPDSLLITILVGWVAYALTRLSNNPYLSLQPVWSYGQSGYGGSLFAGFSIYNLACAAGLLFLLWGVWYLSKGRLFGLGDAKYIAVLTLIFGIRGSMIVFYGALVLGALVSLLLLAIKRAGLKTKLPLGTFISIAATAYIFYGIIFVRHFYYLFV